jgi:hypothetical protein
MLVYQGAWTFSGVCGSAGARAGQPTRRPADAQALQGQPGLGRPRRPRASRLCAAHAGLSRRCLLCAHAPPANAILLWFVEMHNCSQHCCLYPTTGFSNRADGLGFGYRPERLGSVRSIIRSVKSCLRKGVARLPECLGRLNGSSLQSTRHMIMTAERKK